MQEEWRVPVAIGHTTVSQDDDIREIQRGRCNSEDVGFQEAGVMNNAEEIRERCKTEANIKTRRDGAMANIDGVDEDEGARGREESDEWEEFGNRKVVRKHDPRQPGEGGTRDDTSSVSQLVQALHHGERRRRGLS